MAAVDIDLTQFETPAQVARRLGVTPLRVRQLAREGRLEAVSTPLGRLFPREAVDEFIREREQRQEGRAV